MKVRSKALSGRCPARTVGLAVWQDYGLAAHTGECDRAREINDLKEIVRQSYGLGPAKK